MAIKRISFLLNKQYVSFWNHFCSAGGKNRYLSEFRLLFQILKGFFLSTIDVLFITIFFAIGDGAVWYFMPSCILLACTKASPKFLLWYLGPSDYSPPQANIEKRQIKFHVPCKDIHSSFRKTEAELSSNNKPDRFPFLFCGVGYILKWSRSAFVYSFLRLFSVYILSFH